MFDFTGRVALVTGASSGIGRRLSLQLAAAGAKVVAAARRADRLQSLVDEIAAAGGQGLALTVDVTDERSIMGAYDAAEAAFGVVDTVYANAGMNLQGLAVELAAADWDQIMAVNVRGVFLTAREGARRMMKAGFKTNPRGRIVLVSSLGATKVLPGLTAYCASKAAVVSMGRSLAREWANQGINVNVISPGYLITELTDDWFESEGGKKQVAGFPRRRLMAEGDLDAMLLFMGSDASAGSTGGVFNIDDGQSL